HVAGVADEVPYAVRAGDLDRPVGGTVVDDEDLDLVDPRDLRGDRLEDHRQGLFLVEARDLDKQLHWFNPSSSARLPTPGRSLSVSASTRVVTTPYVAPTIRETGAAVAGLCRGLHIPPGRGGGGSLTRGACPVVRAVLPGRGRTRGRADSRGRRGSRRERRQPPPARRP